MMAEAYLNPDQSAVSRWRRIDQASNDFPMAHTLATAGGMKLSQHNVLHYSLVYGDNWLLNIYPSNQRLYHDRERRGLFISLIERPWTLLDVVREVGNALARQKGQADGTSDER